MDQQTKDRVDKLISDQLGVDPERVTPEASLIDDLGADSLDVVELVMGLEEACDVEIPDDLAEKLTTVDDCHDVVRKQLEAKRGRTAG